MFGTVNPHLGIRKGGAADTGNAPEERWTHGSDFDLGDFGWAFSLDFAREGDLITLLVLNTRSTKQETPHRGRLYSISATCLKTFKTVSKRNGQD